MSNAPEGWNVGAPIHDIKLMEKDALCLAHHLQNDEIWLARISVQKDRPSVRFVTHVEPEAPYKRATGAFEITLWASDLEEGASGGFVIYEAHAICS
jgi:hypothetical protein